MSIKAEMSSDGLEEMYSVPTLKELCLYRCLKEKDILTKEMDNEGNGKERTKMKWAKFRLNGPLQTELVEALLDAGSKFLFQMTPQLEKTLAGIRMSQPAHLTKLDLSNSEHLQDSQFEFLFSGGNVKWLDIHGCSSLTEETLDVINKYGSKLEYLRIGHCYSILPESVQRSGGPGILKTPNLKSFIINEFCFGYPTEVSVYCQYLLHDFISKLEELQLHNMTSFENLDFLEAAKNNLKSLSLANCKVVRGADAWASIFKLNKLTSLELIGSTFEQDSVIRGGIVPWILSSMPTLVRLIVDPGLFRNKDLQTFTPVADRLETFGVMDNQVDDLIKANMLAKNVLCFGSADKELQLLEYYANRLNLIYSESTFQRLFSKLNSNATSWQSVTVVGLIMNIYKNSGLGIVEAELFFSIKQKALINEIATKCGLVLKDQCVDILLFSMDRLSYMTVRNVPPIVVKLIDMLNTLNPKLPLEQCAYLLSVVTSLAEKAVVDRALRLVLTDKLKQLLRSTAQLLDMAIGRFCSEELTECWGMSSVLKVINEFPGLVRQVEKDEFRVHIVESLCIFVNSLRKLCLNSPIQRQALLSAGVVQILLRILDEIYNGSLQLAERTSFTLLDILKSILQDRVLDISDPDTIASCLKRLEGLISKRTEVDE